MIDPTETTDTPRRLIVTAWDDGVLRLGGHRPGSAYVEAVWLGVLGPSATWAWQRLARLAEASPGTRIDTVDLAVSLGLGERLGRNASISRTLHRLDAFEVTQRTGDVIAVRLRLPDVPDRRLGRLSPTARLAHDRFSIRSEQRQAVPQGVEAAAGVRI